MDRWDALRERLPRPNPLLTDGLVALAAAALALVELQERPDPRDRATLNIGFVLLQTLPLVARRRLPFTVFAVAAGSLAVQGTAGLYSPTFALLAFNLAVYSLAAYGTGGWPSAAYWSGPGRSPCTLAGSSRQPGRTSRSPTSTTSSTTTCCWPPPGS